jgi:hypothetical protein
VIGLGLSLPPFREPVAVRLIAASTAYRAPDRMFRRLIASDHERGI